MIRKVRLFIQRPPRVQWVLLVLVEDEKAIVKVRTWFNEYSPGQIPPPAVTVPAAILCDEIARAALAGVAEEARIFSLQVERL